MYYNFGSKLHSFFSQIKMEMHEVIVYILQLLCIHVQGKQYLSTFGEKSENIES